MVTDAAAQLELGLMDEDDDDDDVADDNPIDSDLGLGIEVAQPRPPTV